MKSDDDIERAEWWLKALNTMLDHIVGCECEEHSKYFPFGVALDADGDEYPPHISAFRDRRGMLWIHKELYEIFKAIFDKENVVEH